MLLIVSRLNHICSILLVAFLVISNTSCTPWREAKGVIAEADRLLEYGEIIEDTALLAATINTFNGPLGYVFARNDLAKAYYHMARNFYHAHDYATAADYYILCDRLKPSDPMYKGRVNSCMGFLCKQDSCFAEALEFYERANEAFVNDERRYANGLVSIAEQYVCLKEYAKADSVLQLAGQFDVDSACYARMVDVRALALYNQQKYDSALVCLLSIKDFVRPIDAKCHSYMKIMHCYEFINQLDNAIVYAEYIILNSQNPLYCSNAYFFLIEDAKANHDMQRVVEYSRAREDENRKIQHDAELCAQATLKLKDYIRNPHPGLYLWIGVGCIILMAGGGMWIYRRKTNQVAAEKQQMEVELLTWKENILQKLDRDKEDIMNEKRMIIRNIIMEYADEFAIGKSVWDKDKDVFRLADSCFGFVIHRLKHKYNIRNSELKICLMVLLDFPTKDCAKMTSYTEKGYPTIKRRLAERLGTSSGEMRDFLIDFIAKII